MLKFIARLFAVIGFVVVVLVVVAVTAFHRFEPAMTPEPAKVVLNLNFDVPIIEQYQPSPLDFMAKSAPVPLLDLVRAIDRAKDDPHVVGIVAHFGASQPSLTQAQELRAALARFRKSGKFTYAYGTDFGEFGSGNCAYYLASAFDNIWLQPVGSISLTGVAVQELFGKAMLDKIGVTADFMKRKQYKDFMDRAQLNAFAPQVKIEMQGLADDLANQIAQGIATSRNWDIARVKALIAQGPYTAEEAQQAGLVTRLAYADELKAEIDKKAGESAKRVDAETYLNYGDIGAADSRPQNKVALIYGDGLIMDSAPGGGSITGGDVMSAASVAKAFTEAADDKNVKAVLFRVDSPGGSPSASETIRRAMIYAESKGKPVIVSMGGVAASGGYWVAMNGSRIVADPGTLTGSIGVLAGKPAINGLLKKIGVTADGVYTASNAAMWSIAAPFNDFQRARVNALLDDTYRTFVGDVSAARQIPLAKMPGIAGGRVYTGDQAVKNGLVDELGGYDVALAAVRHALKLGDKATISLQNFPPPPSAAERFLRLMRRFGAESAEVSSSLSVLARVQNVLQPLLGLAAEIGQPVAARMPMERIHE
ncbi:MAG: signal peptide peptidase SppA [Alphaproteobacteria bacterium]|nr:signal peptide peptidase SppA [Alphaproteobacteria bacterium]